MADIEQKSQGHEVDTISRPVIIVPRDSACIDELRPTITSRHRNCNHLGLNKYSDKTSAEWKEVGEALNSMSHRPQRYAMTDEFRKIAAWLSPPDPGSNHELACQLREPGTGTWLLESEQYQKWKTFSSRHLWLHGKAGCGKTVLCSTAIEDIKAYCNNQLNVGLAMFYFSFSDDRKQRYADLLRSLVKQLGWREPALSLLQQAYGQPYGSLPGSEKLENIMIACLDSHDEVFVLLDALDECPEDSDMRQDVIKCLERLSQRSPKLKILVTSRELPQIRDFMAKLAAQPIGIESHTVDPDIRKYIATQLACDDRLSILNDATKSLIEATLSEKADGM